jgi:sugar/nucleoside kinase (ribokinase family)
MRYYGHICGRTLARAHARAGDRVAIAAYLGKSDRFENAIADFAEACAEQNLRDHAELARAADTGRVIAQTGIKDRLLVGQSPQSSAP